MNPYNTKRLPWKKTHHSIFSLDASEEIQMMQEDDPDWMRRNKFSLLCQKLQKMVPNVLAKVRRVELIDETISHIKALEETIRELEAEKRAREGHNRPSVLEYTKERSCMIVWAFGNKAAFLAANLEAVQDWPTKSSKPWKPKKVARYWPPPPPPPPPPARLSPSRRRWPSTLTPSWCNSHDSQPSME